MPITQDRMLGLIAAAQAYRSAYRAIAHTFADLQAGKLDIATAIHQYRDHAGTLSDLHGDTIAREDAHFAAWQGKNYRNAKRRADQRRQEAKSPDWRQSAIAHNAIPGNAPTRAELEADVAEWLKLQEQLEANKPGTNGPKSAANESQSEAKFLESLDKTSSEQPVNKR